MSARRVVSLAVVVAAMLAAPLVADEVPRLFEVVGAKVYTVATDDPGVVRRQVAVADRGLLDGGMLDRLELPARLGVDLFGDARIARFDTRHETLVGPVLIGRLDGADGTPVAGSRVTLAWSSGSMTVDVIAPDGVFSLHPAPGGGLVLDAIDERLRPAGAEPIPGTGAFSDRSLDIATKDSGSRIDVSVVYTADARLGAGGVAALEQRIATGIAQLNQAFADSDVATSVRLVHTAEIPYIEGNWDIGIDVAALQRKGDGRLDEAHVWRDEHGADLVAMIGENSTGACGIAYLMDGATNAAFEAEAFSYTARSCLNGSYTLPHELAHNMGSNHARDDPIKEGAYDFSYGWKDGVNRFRTVMAYPCPGVACQQLLRFSNPRQTWNGAPLGNSVNDNARSLQGVRSTVANFRQERTTVNRGRIEMVDEASTVAEDGTLGVRVRRLAGNSGTVGVGYRTVDGTAIGGDDFAATEGRLTWAAGEVGSQTVSIPLIDDAEVESTETFRVELFDVEGATLGPASTTVTITDDDEDPFQPFTCVSDTTTLCLQQGRFQVRLSYRTGAEQGDGQVVEGVGSQDSGLYYLFDAANWEMLIKVLDGCGINQRFWVLAAATTDLGYTLEIVDSRTGVTRRYDNPVGRAAPALVDTFAFATCDD